MHITVRPVSEYMSPDLTQKPGIGRSEVGPGHAYSLKSSPGDSAAVLLVRNHSVGHPCKAQSLSFINSLILFSFVQALHEYKDLPR